MPLPSKRQRGQYFTEGNPFRFEAFRAFMEAAPDGPILEPFAGANHLVRLMREAGFEREWVCFDIAPPANQMEGVAIGRRDTLRSFPKSFGLAITNPPYLAKNSARRRGLAFPKTEHDDLYKLALETMLAKAGHVAAIIPASFLSSGLFLDRLQDVISLTSPMFKETACPVCLALFVPQGNGKVALWDEGQFLGYLDDLGQTLGPAEQQVAWVFNEPTGEIGLRGVDNTKGPSICFVAGDEIPPGDIKFTSRAITRISGIPKGLDPKDLIERANAALDAYRLETHDMLLTPFKGLRDDGKYRRRLDFATARRLLDQVVGTLRIGTADQEI